ncbi:hypothetical protein D9615_002191 [Tricholomella constricta]|uniref:C2H2-type domain-containing protein n=1 Tax=Tricholomella constricta TaxID=117010 RepID=A0A8H5HM55_9AGAR|nr:hypothetical protein D9615_002191 [Tricholomella constricta]
MSSLNEARKRQGSTSQKHWSCSSRSQLSLSFYHAPRKEYPFRRMDLGMDMDMTPQPAADVVLAHYFGPTPTNNVSGREMPWQEADHHHYNHSSLGLFHAPSLVSWSEDEANKYVVGNHPMVIQEHELDLALSDHSNTTPSDSDSRGSSNSYSTGSLPSHGESSMAPESDWQNFPVTYSPQGQLADPAVSVYGLVDEDHHADSLFMHHRVDTDSLTVNPATFHNVPPQNGYVARVRSHPRSPLSSSSPLLSLDDHRCISISELNAPYVPDQQAHSGHGTGPRMASSSEDLCAGSNTRKRSSGIETTRGRGGYRGARGGGGRNNVRSQARPTVPVKGSSRMKRRTPSFTSSSSDSEARAPIPKRPRRSIAIAIAPKQGSDAIGANENDNGESEPDDSDVYSPSRSPSPDLSASEYSESGGSPLVFSSSSRTSKKMNKVAKGKKLLQIGAADALAQMSRTSSSIHASSSPNNVEQDGGEWEPTNTMGCTASSRKNRTIPLPVPVPHLTKNSRGRKVPYVNVRAARGLALDDPTYDGDDDDYGHGMRGAGGPSRQGRGRAVARGRGGGGGRAFVCTVEGCGKCFIRGEHLKRHVRSIHTNDKPHPCPYPGCGKSFSRRDNLGQHRLHCI